MLACALFVEPLTTETLFVVPDRAAAAAAAAADAAGAAGMGKISVVVSYKSWASDHDGASLVSFVAEQTETGAEPYSRVLHKFVVAVWP